MENVNKKIEKLNNDVTKFSEDIGGLVINLTREIQKLNSEVLDLKNNLNREVGKC